MAYKWQSGATPGTEKPHTVRIRTVGMRNKFRAFESQWNPARFSVILPP